MKRIELVCFDLGGVLVRLVRGWEHAVEVAGVMLPSKDAMGNMWERHQELAHALELGDITEDAFERGVGECFPGVDCGGYWRVFDAWLMGLYPGVGELIGEIKASGRKVGVLSNTNARHWRTLLAGEYAALNEVDYLVASHLIRTRKPEGEAYRRVEEVSGVKSGGILFFDDKGENVEAAREVGWEAEVVDPTRDGVGQVREHLVLRGVLGSKT